ncbi:hypothetical protein ACVWYO_003190 [Sphingomonas sp. UYP23]
MRQCGNGGRFGPIFNDDFRRQRVKQMRGFWQWDWL